MRGGSNKQSGGQKGHKGSKLDTVTNPDKIVVQDRISPTNAIIVVNR